MDISQVVSTVSLTIEPTTPGISKRSTILTQCTTIMILPDTIVEEDETFTISLSTRDSQVNLSPSNMTVVIVNNDRECLFG